MFVGHEFLAFALAAGAIRLAGRPPRTALVAGGAAALCALLPDLDLAYGLGSYLLAVGAGTPLSWDAFWGVTNGVHRVVTHPLPIGVAATLAFSAAIAGVRALDADRAHSARDRSAAVTVSRVVAVAAVALGVTAAAVVVSATGRTAGDAAVVVAGAYLLTVVVVGGVVARQTDCALGALAFAAGVGFLTHPFGDVLMAGPPPLLAPFATTPAIDRVVVATDETVNLLSVLFVEVATVWAGLLVALRLTGRRLGDAVAGRAVVGVAYAAAAFTLPRPTMADAHVLGFTVVPLAVVVGATAGVDGGPGNGGLEPGRTRLDRTIRAVATGLATLTVAAASYLLAYLLL